MLARPFAPAGVHCLRARSRPLWRQAIRSKGHSVFQYGFVHAVLVDWAGHRRREGFAAQLLETVSVLGDGQPLPEERLRLVEAAAERAAESGVRTMQETDEVTVLRTMDRHGLLTPGQAERLGHAAGALAHAEEV